MFDWGLSIVDCRLSIGDCQNLKSQISNRRSQDRRGLESEETVLPVLQAYRQDARRAVSLQALLGIEGQAAKRYFSIYRQAFAPEWAFEKRTRRPPKDPINALLSLGYVFLGYAVMGALEIVGLDPYLGYFHTEKYGRPALALDLVEEFRVPVVDSLLESRVTDRRIGRPLSYRKLFEVQARKLAHFIQGEQPAYRPFRMR